MSEEVPAVESARVCLVVSRFNQLVTERLERGARRALAEEGLPEENVATVRVAGAWELPFAVRWAMRNHDAVIAVGCVVRGETPHFEYICQGATQGLMACQSEGTVPVSFGLLTTDTLQQAMERSGGEHGNKGEEAAKAALELYALADG